MTNTSENFGISPAAAEVYESRFVPAIFAQWAPRLLDQAAITTGTRVLDVACGTGIVARVAADRVGPSGRVVGVDASEAMLAVARRLRPDLEWHRGDAGALPFADGSFDAALCQMALMFFPDRARALREMRRVATEMVAVCVPAALDEQPAYRDFVDVAVRHAGPPAASLLGTYWSCGDRDELRGWFRDAGLTVDRFTTHTGSARFPSVDAMVATEVEGSPLIERLDAGTYEAITSEARTVLARFTDPDGSVSAPLVAHIVTAR
ncbi:MULTISPECIES: methyltransferase domain-containing protein [Rhodococcus]|uniref:2-heptaprenyl-1,4-naphthoquinone methyltransferase n=1 Tax=Rhodococcus aetherivorans TaxID=191292 RepID=A0A059MVP4_9NOCA|nr:MULTISPECIES: methyltransferase domain-containing protein [Rhodococcus]ETT27940.1 Methyltransferase type 11 [Rhodococcus rhodochrous ATCC 21198]NCL73322.1 Ubiquinone/menaquinone biosynthesis C-methyltransferase UbiE [Rhodococcus sp. YH1]AKE89029.1 methyltransferase [Rhodococcus aetherivorans]ANZ26278.1 methyltransferase [Rhodococcus sp. WB1]KDE15254.1 methyltransferase [Rhodococcus aetherivorans]